MNHLIDDKFYVHWAALLFFVCSWIREFNLDQAHALKISAGNSWAGINNPNKIAILVV